MKKNGSHSERGEYRQQEFTITILGRLLEHLGVQMYKRRTVAIAELVANCWDAGANNVWITVPERDQYDRHTSAIVIMDDGVGMSPTQVDDYYLVVGRNRRTAGQPAIPGRPEMGRKGIGKLAGFGVATEMTLLTWPENGESTEITLNITDLKQESGVSRDVPVQGTVGPVPAGFPTRGTRVELRNLKHVTPLDVNELREALGRRFSRRARGEMKIFVNEQELQDPFIDFDIRVPEDGYNIVHLPDGNEVRYFYGFSKKPLQSREMRGWTIYVREKTAEAPPFFFNVEATASGQHSTKYLTGEIFADFIDEGVDDESDRVSTDRQEIDWDDPAVHALREWGIGITRYALRARTQAKGVELRRSILDDLLFRRRVERLDARSQEQVSRLLDLLGASEPDPERVGGLADALIKSFEYQHFHDVIGDIEAVSDNPEGLQRLLGHLHDWKVLESRTILEIINGRLGIIEKFHQMIVNDAPETAHNVGDENMHDLIADYPWLINPEWQVLAEERTISRQLREWNANDVGDEVSRQRYDFLALGDEKRLIVIEIKRAGWPVTFEETQRLEVYQSRLLDAWPEIHMVLVCGSAPALKPNQLAAWEERPDGEIIQWRDVYQRTKKYYEHYRAVLEGDVEDAGFGDKRREVLRTREILTGAPVYRSRDQRRAGIGPQDVSYTGETSPLPPGANIEDSI
jgi:hypothetical protein